MVQAVTHGTKPSSATPVPGCPGNRAAAGAGRRPFPGVLIGHSASSRLS